MSNNYWETKTPECFAANPPCCWSKTPELQLKCLQQPTNEVCLNSAEGKVERREKEMMFSHYLPEQHGGLVQYSAQSPFYICSQESRTCSVYTKMYLNINVYFTSENFLKPRQEKLLKKCFFNNTQVFFFLLSFVLFLLLLASVMIFWKVPQLLSSLRTQDDSSSEL